MMSFILSSRYKKNLGNCKDISKQRDHNYDLKLTIFILHFYHKFHLISHNRVKSTNNTSARSTALMQNILLSEFYFATVLLSIYLSIGKAL